MNKIGRGGATYISEPVVLMGFLDGLEGISDNDHKKIHHDRHREEDPSKHKECTKDRIELHNFLEGVGDFVSQHNTEKTEESDAWVSETESRPEYSQAKHTETNKEGQHICSMSYHVRT